MRRWIVWVGGAAVLGLVAWYFGKPAETPVVVIAKPQAAVAEAPKAPPPKVLEVIDLARAYEPVPEPDDVHPGGVNPATFIQLPAAAERIPPARDGDELYADVIRTVREAPSGWSFWHRSEREHLDLMPREVRPVPNGLINGLIDFVPTPEVAGGLVFVPMGVPYARPQLPPGVPCNAPVEALDVMPREVEFNPTSLNFRATVTVTGELVFTPMGNPVGPRVEELDVMPREVPFVPSRFPCICEPEILNFVCPERSSIHRVPVRIEVLSPGGAFIPQGPWIVNHDWLEFLAIVAGFETESPERLDVMPREVDGPMQDLLHVPPELGWM